MAGPVQYSLRLGRPVYLLSASGSLVSGIWYFFSGSASWFWFFAVAQLLLTLCGNFVFASGIFGRVLCAGPTDRPVLALTFDDGPDPHTTPAVLEVLERHGAKATFFVIGERAGQHPEVIARMVSASHQVENHTQRHAHLTAFFSKQRLVQELSLAQQTICAAGAPSPRFFRPPAGVLSPPVAFAARRLGLTLVGWSKKARDGWSCQTVEAATERLSRALRPGAILLLHDARENTGTKTREPIAPKVLERLLPMLLARGLRAVTLDELLANQTDKKT